MDAPQFEATSIDPEIEAKAALEERLRAHKDALVIEMILDAPEGRDWFYRLLERCHIYGSPFSPGQPDLTAFRLGEENIGKQLLADAQAVPNLYLKMIRE